MVTERGGYQKGESDRERQPALVKPINSGIEAREYNSVSVPSRAAIVVVPNLFRSSRMR
jgi:hypothetical protein